MQGINATLIVQVINFGIAYLILRKFVFAPGVALVLKERAVEESLHKEVARTIDYAQREKERLSAEWLVKQQKLITQIPQLPEELFVLRHIKPEVSFDVLPSKEESVRIQKEVVQALVFSVEAKQ